MTLGTGRESASASKSASGIPRDMNMNLSATTAATTALQPNGVANPVQHSTLDMVNDSSAANPSSSSSAAAAAAVVEGFNRGTPGEGFNRGVPGASSGEGFTRGTPDAPGATAGDGFNRGVPGATAGASRRIVDLRSDTVTRPSAAMRAAMSAADVDDDVLGVDPTVDVLQKQVAQLLGKEAALFVPSGTMGNLICVLVHCEQRGSEVILGADSHIHYYEQGGISTLGGVHPRTVPNKSDGTMDLRKIELAIRKEDDHFPITRLICVENTHNRCGGRVIPVEYMEKVGELAKWYNLKLHVDGARLMNAAAALKVAPDMLLKNADSVSLCLSKGLGAPLGSVIAGKSEFIAKARRLRKALGGGMRQVGVVAAPCIVALQDAIPRLQRDHQLAQQLAEGLNTLDGLHVDMDTLETNIIVLDVKSECPLGAEELVSALKTVGVLSLPLSSNKLRLVTHCDVTSDDIRYALACFQEILLRASLEEDTGMFG